MLRKPPEWMTYWILKSEYKTFLNWVVWRYSSSKVEKKNAQHCQISHMKFCYLSFENVSHISRLELRSTWILKNKIRRRPMSASVVSLSELPILVNPRGGNYVWPDSWSNGIRRRHNGSVVYLIRFPFLFIMETGTEFLRGSQKFIWSWTCLTNQNRRPKFYGD